MTPLVSIISPTYNHGQFIERCIDSVLAQTFDDWEMLILDDGSKDDTVDRVLKYKDPRIKLTVQENVGILRLSESYNKLLSQASGMYVAVLEGDDYWPPNKLEIQIPLFEDDNTVMTCGSIDYVDENDNFLRHVPENADRYVALSPERFTGEYMRSGFIGASSVMLRTSELVKMGGFKQIENAPYVDYSTWLFLSVRGKVVFSDKMLGYHRRHTGQVTDIHQIEMAEAHRRVLLAFFDSLDDEGRRRIGLTQEEVRNIADRRVAQGYFDKASVLLRKKEWKSAKECVRTASREGTFKLKVRSLVLNIMASLHISY